MYNVSACVFIRNTFEGAFCIFESMASLLPYVKEFLVMDLGSTDGTLELLREIEAANQKVRLVQDRFPEIDAAAFATLANDLVEMCSQPYVLFYQSDEIWHQDLLGLMDKEFQQGNFDLSFWRIQYGQNFQRLGQGYGWFPHLVHRVGSPGKFHFKDDGMTTDRTWDAKICSTYDGGWYPKWGGMDPVKLPANEMIMDVSLLGGFRDNIPQRRRLHAPFWHEEPKIQGKPAEQWLADEMSNPNWTKTSSPFNLPAIMHWHVGRTTYELRPELLQALKEDNTLPFLTPDEGWR